MSKSETFRFKQFSVRQDGAAFKVGTDGVLLGVCVEENGARDILDIGTGTGLIALILAQRFPAAKITGIELDKKSASLAKENFFSSKWRDNLHLIHSDISEFAGRPELPEFDLIVSNPPFFSSGTLPESKSRSNARHQSSLSLKDLLRCSNNLMRPSARLALVLPLSELPFLEAAMESVKFVFSKRISVRSKVEKPVRRLVVEMMRGSEFAGTTVEKELVMQKEKRNSYTSEYLLLVRAFYLAL